MKKQYLHLLQKFIYTLLIWLKRYSIRMDSIRMGMIWMDLIKAMKKMKKMMKMMKMMMMNLKTQDRNLSLKIY